MRQIRNESENWKIKIRKIGCRRSRQLYREQRPQLNLNQTLEEINWNIRTRENSLTKSPVSFSVQTSIDTTRENSPEQSNDENLKKDRRSRRNSNNNQPLEIVEEENIEEQKLGGLREYLQEFEIEQEIQRENNIEPIVENNIMDILALRSRKFKGDGTQDPVEWLKNYEKMARMNGWTDDQKKERIYTVLDDAADKWYNEIYTITYRIDNDRLPTWTEIKNLFITRELEKLKQQPGESVDQYAARFKKIIRKKALAMQDVDKLYHFKKGLRKGMLPLISMHNPEDIATVIKLAQYYEEAEDLEEGLEPEESEDEIKPKPKTKRKIKKKKYESESSDEETPIKKKKVKKKEVEVDPIEELIKKMNELTIKLTKTERLQYNNNIRSRNYDIKCYNCGKKGHISKNCKGNDRNNQNQTPAHYVSIENGNEYETEEEDREIIALWNEQLDSFGNPKETKKRPIEPELIYDYRTDPDNKKKKTPNKNNVRKLISKTPGKVKNEEYTSKLLQGPELDIVKKLKEQKIEITLPQLFKISSNEKRKVIEALKKPKEVSARFTNQKDFLRTTTLECDIIVNRYTVPATIDSGAATSIIARNTMKQLEFEVTNCKIISANGEKTKSLGKIKNFLVEINDKSKQELTLNWRNQVIKTTASCKQNNTTLKSIEEEYEKNSDLEDIMELGNSLSPDKYILKPGDIKNGKLDKEQQETFNKLINKYKDIFAEEINQLGRTNITQHKIELEEGTKPIK
ncbi:hypothetical protein Glove_109g339 [Diversispora epigaea]|uniref:CCHC-type domain-containing protein n=1 Tax=Diversispora epigaea TaxID=1348612 RepID=A0A397JCV0_9GLOM|nr:hypothetical protein Glove_109g339 [Diversispora epigaea]